jgi:hypothetical protein
MQCDNEETPDCKKSSIGIITLGRDAAIATAGDLGQVKLFAGVGMPMLAWLGAVSAASI